MPYCTAYLGYDNEGRASSHIPVTYTVFFLSFFVCHCSLTLSQCLPENPRKVLSVFFLLFFFFCEPITLCWGWQTLFPCNLSSYIQTRKQILSRPLVECPVSILSWCTLLRITPEIAEKGAQSLWEVYGWISCNCYSVCVCVKCARSWAHLGSRANTIRRGPFDICQREQGTERWSSLCVGLPCPHCNKQDH